MTERGADVVICGAGIAGIAAAYHLAVRRGVRDIVLVDERPPLTLTSDKSAECYRNWWPGPGDAMVAAMNRSIDLLEELAHESGNVFRMNRRGYLFATADPARLPVFEAAAAEAAALGAGPVRRHDRPGSEYHPPPVEGFDVQPIGTDLITDRSLIRRHFGWLADDTIALLHARRCGWLSGQQLGMYLLERARDKGVRLLEGRVEGVETAGGRVSGVKVSGAGGTRTLTTPRFVAAGGPLMRPLARLVGVDLPLFCERHAKVSFTDTLGALPREAPLTIWTDPVRLVWSEEERAELAGSEEPAFPVQFDPAYAEIVIRGASRMVPAMAGYLPRLPRAFVDGGYYTKTRENRFLSGPLPLEGAFVIGGLSGYGIMASNTAADLLADHVTGRPLPAYAPAFLPSRYEDPAYQALLENWGDSGQL
jgi:glycine/D-amino acid oxidase-like deaminating enzyme